MVGKDVVIRETIKKKTTDCTPVYMLILWLSIAPSCPVYLLCYR